MRNLRKRLPVYRTPALVWGRRFVVLPEALKKDMPFQKGNQYGKAKRGRPPLGHATAELMRLAGDLKYRGTDKTRREQAVEAIWEKACNGELAAFQMILERTEGKVPDKSEQSGELRINVRYEDSGPAERGERGSD